MAATAALKHRSEEGTFPSKSRFEKECTNYLSSEERRRVQRWKIGLRPEQEILSAQERRSDDQ